MYIHWIREGECVVIMTTTAYLPSHESLAILGKVCASGFYVHVHLRMCMWYWERQIPNLEEDWKVT